MKLTLVLVFTVLSAYIIVSYASKSHCPKPRAIAYGYISKGRSNAYKVGHSIQFACRRGYRLVGSSWLKCLRRGNRYYWNHPIPICRKIIIILKRCPKLADPRYGNVKLTGTHVGAKAIYKCNRGFKLVGGSVRKCLFNRRWSGRAPFCKRIIIVPRRCPKLPDPRYGNVKLTGTHVGAKAIYKCNRGFKLVGGSVRKCLSNRRWSGRAPFCKRIIIVPPRCPKLADPRYGNVKLTGTHVGAKAIYKCNRGFKLVGGSVRKCLFNRRWSGRAPFCKRIIIVPPRCPKLADPRYGNVKLTGTHIGAKAIYKCNRGFKLVGGSVRKCLSNRRWSGRAPFCKKIIQCERLIDPQNGNVNFNGVSVGSKATYSCDKGFRLIGSTQRKCQANGQWSGTQPICKEINCGSLNDPSNGNVELSGTTVGSQATYTCNAGFTLEGNSVRKCQVNGEWSGQEPTCTAIDCGSLDDPDNGQVDLPTGSLVGANAIYTCDQGFELVGSKQRTCQGNGQWSDEAPVCQPIDCGSLDAPDNGQVDLPTGSLVGANAIYTCDQGFELVGSKQRTCQGNGQWSDEAPVCQPIDCGSLDDPDNGQVDLPTGSLVGANAIYTCDQGFELVGSKQRTCQGNGQWSDEAPVCQPIDCGSLDAPDNGQVDLPTGSLVGANAVYTCDQGFELVGSKQRTCQGNGQWSDEAPVCQPIDCGILKDPRNGQVKFDSTTFGSSAKYTCNKGFRLVGDDVRQCQINGQWSNDEPICRKIVIVKCKQLSPPKYGQVHISGSGVGAVAHYSCYFGYTLVGPSKRTCQAGGYWTHSSPKCIKKVYQG